VSIQKESNKRYGAPKIHEQLLKEDAKVSIKRAQRFMEKTDILKKYRPTPTKKPVEERKNVLEQDFQTTTINKNG